MNADICHFVQLHGLQAGQVAVFQSGRIRIGVGDQCDLMIPDLFAGLPAEAAEVLLLDDGDFHLNPVQGRVPVLINGRVVTRLTPLRSEDYIRIGESGPELLFRHGHPDSNLGSRIVPEYPVVQLQFIDGSLAGQDIVLKLGRPVSIGRLPSMDVRLDPRVDITVSGRHCTLRWDDAGAQFILTDCSRNKTYVDDAPVDGEALVLDGSEIRLSSSGPRFVFTVRGPQRDYPNGIPSAPREQWSDDADDDMESFESELPLPSPSFPAQTEFGDFSAPEPEYSALPELRIPTDPVDDVDTKPRDGSDHTSRPFSGIADPEFQEADSRMAQAEALDEFNFGDAPPSSTPQFTAHFSAKEPDYPPARGASDPPTDPGEVTNMIDGPAPSDSASVETVAQPFRPGSSPMYFTDPESKRAAVGSGGTWPRKGAIGPTLEPPVSGRRSSGPASSFANSPSRRGRLGDLAIPTGKVPAVPIRLNLIRKEVAAAALTSGSGPLGASSDALGSESGGSSFVSRIPWMAVLPVLVILGIIVSISSRKSPQLDPTDPLTHLSEPGRTVAIAMRKPQTVENKEGGFTATLPSDWDREVTNGVLQASSPDGKFSLDVVRYGELSTEKAREIVSQDGSTVSTAPKGTVNGVTVETFAVKSDSSVGRVGVLMRREQGNSAPVLAVFEGENRDLETIPREVLSQILVSGISIADAAPSRPLAAVKATPVAATPTPGVAVAPTSSPTANPDAVMNLASAGITVSVPSGWTGTEDSDAGILGLESPDGTDIRITTTEEPLSEDQVFRALQTEGWIEVGIQKMENVRVGQFRLGAEHISVAVVGRNTLPAGVIYGRRNAAWNQQQLSFLGSVAGQVAKQP